MFRARRVRVEWLAYLIPTLAAAALYAPTLSYDRTFDDVHVVPEPGIKPSGGWARVWTGPYWETNREGGLYRPVTSSTYWLEAQGGLPLSARHGLNVILHCAVTLLLVRLALSLGLGAGSAGIAGVLFALHPAHVEAVAGLVGRAEILSALVLLLALWFHDRTGKREGVEGGRPAAILPAAAIAFLAAGTKESAWALPIFAVVLHLARGRAFRPAWPLWTGYGAGIVAHLVLRRWVLAGWLNTPEFKVTTFDNPLVALHGSERILGGLRMVGLNLGHLLYPLRLAPDYSGGGIDPAGGSADPRLWGGVLLLVGCTFLVARVRRSPNRAGAIASAVGAGWLLVSALLFMNLFLSIGTIFADRILYWPSLAFSLLLGGTLATLGEGAVRGPSTRLSAPLRTVVGGLLLALAVGYAVRAVEYLPAWKNDETLFREGVRVSPTSVRAWYNLGQSEQNQNRFEEAINAYRRVEELDPSFQLAWAMEATVLMRMGRWDEARGALASALRLDPGDVLSLLNEGVLWMQNGDLERAEARFRQILADDPDRMEAIQNLALIEMRSGRPREAAAKWRRFLEKDPDSVPALNNLAWLLATELGNPEEGALFARKAVALAPANANMRDTLAEALRRMGRIDEAIAEAQEALRLEPGEKYRKRLEEISAARPR